MFILNKQNMSAIECYPSTSKAKESIPPSLDQVSALPYYQMNGREPPISRTANFEAGLRDLECLAKKMTSQSLGMKLMSELKDEQIGTNEIEALAAKRRDQRNDKMGEKKSENLNAFAPKGARDTANKEKQLKIRRS